MVDTGADCGNTFGDNLYGLLAFQQSIFVVAKYPTKTSGMKLYSKKQILKAAELGEVSMIDAKHIVSLLDEVVEKEAEEKEQKSKLPPCDHYWIKLTGKYWCRKCCAFSQQ